MKTPNLLLALIIIFSSCKKNEEILPVATIEDSSKASILSPAYGLAHAEYAKPGPYQVSTNAVRGDCQQLFGITSKILASINLLDPGVRCNPSFPYGFDKQFTTEVYYPTNIQSLEKLPVISFVGGILSNLGHYTTLAELWASYGFIVVNSNDFINITPTMHIFGALEITRLNNDPTSTLYNKVDLSRFIVAGHSMGGGASILTASIPQQALNLIDPTIRIVGALPLQPGPFALGASVKSPVLLLTGGADIIVSPLGWPQLQSKFISNVVPTWTGTAKYATHFSPTMELNRNEYAGISVAWMLYRGKDDANASTYFLGKDYKLSKDDQFFQLRINPLRVQRNKLADKLNPLSPVGNVTTTQ